MLAWALSASFALSLPYLCVAHVPIVNPAGDAAGLHSVLNTAVKRDVLTATARAPGQLRAVENSGVCETTPGVYQASGYGDLNADDSMWYVLLLSNSIAVAHLLPTARFWYFDARKDPETAPLTIYVGGGVRRHQHGTNRNSH